jgi:hypothetical protein
MKTKPNFTAYLALALTLAAHLSAAGEKSKAKLAGPGVTVYVLQDNLVVPDLNRAEQVAAEVFITIGVPLTFRLGAVPKPAAESTFLIELQLDSRVSAQFHPGALAYASPFGNSGTRIHVFCDRVRASWPDGSKGILLGYVLAHEIAHVLQGVSRHSEEGVMKARWQQSDYQQMRTGLPFDPTDAEMIRERLAKVATLSTRTAQ